MLKAIYLTLFVLLVFPVVGYALLRAFQLVCEHLYLNRGLGKVMQMAQQNEEELQGW